MSIHTRVLTNVELPRHIDIEVTDTVTGRKTVQTVDFSECLRELGSLGALDLQDIAPEQLFSAAFALAKHHAVDAYLRSIGVDPHAHLSDSDLAR